MIPELGQFALVLALSAAIVQFAVPLIGLATRTPAWIGMARSAAQTQFMLVALSYACLTYSFITHDFSVSYVAQTSNTQLPLIYRISGVWGGHEGSILLWVFVLAAWTYAVAIFNRAVPADLHARVLAVMGMISTGFLLFVLLTSNPFARQFPIPLDGNSLNPLLQDPGMAIHPPLLYMGYVGFSVAFAFAVAALISGKLDMATVRWMRPWTNVAWLFLTLGITLGSFWAYYELGWGGWWFWDPVENASFMPWLAGTALLHSLAASEKRGVFKAWTVLLAVTAFSLSLLGTFLVRSGVLTSVHAFASDPERGLFILLFLLLVVGGSLLLFAFRASSLQTNNQFALVSRESGLLFNNVLLIVACASVLIGTLYPLFLDALGLGKISVGAPWFNFVFIPVTAPLALMVGIGAMLNWKRDSLGSHKIVFTVLAILTIVTAVALTMLLPHFHFGAVLGIGLAVWVTVTTLYGLVYRVRNKRKKLYALTHTPAAFWGMTLAHLGIAVFTVGVALVSLYNTETDLRMEPGDSHEIGGYNFLFEGARQVRGPNYSAAEGRLVVTRDNEPVTVLKPQKRIYDVRRDTMTEASIDAGLTRDLFAALGEPLETTGSNREMIEGAWSVRLYHKPFIRWIWFGAVLMALGGMLAASDRRYRVASRSVAAPARKDTGSSVTDSSAIPAAGRLAGAGGVDGPGLGGRGLDGRGALES